MDSPSDSFQDSWGFSTVVVEVVGFSWMLMGCPWVRVDFWKEENLPALAALARGLLLFMKTNICLYGFIRANFW